MTDASPRQALLPTPQLPPSPGPLVDSHAHLDLAHFDEDRTAVLQRAAQAGVCAVVIPGITVQSSAAIAHLAAAWAEPAGTGTAADGETEQAAAGSPASALPRVYGAVGVHPNSSGAFAVPQAADAAIATLRRLAAEPAVVAIGEIGLDNYWKDVEPAVQAEALARQLALAAEVGKPVIIHSREANEQVAAVLRDWVAGAHFRASPLARRPFAGVLHAFSGDAALAEEAYAWGFVLSLGGPVTYRSARSLHALAPLLRPDRLMLETDAPYLTPHPHRGARNEPAALSLICRELARLRSEEPQQLAQATTAVAVEFFRLES